MTTEGRGTSLGESGGKDGKGKSTSPRKSRKEIGWGEGANAALEKPGQRLDSLKESLLFPEPKDI